MILSLKIVRRPKTWPRKPGSPLSSIFPDLKERPFSSWIIALLLNKAKTYAKREGRYTALAQEEDHGDGEPAVSASRFDAAGCWVEPPTSFDGLIRRFLLHVLPEGFHRIRYYGFLGNRYRAQKLACCRDPLDMPVPEPSDSRPPKDYRDRYEELTGHSLRQCPACHQGQMIIIEVFDGVTGPPRYWDTS